MEDQPEPVVFAGFFKDMDHFDRFAKKEHLRPNYRQIPFAVVTSFEVTEEKYQEAMQQINSLS